MNTNRYKESLFAAIEAACLINGGDGEVVVISPNPTKSANSFEKFLSDTNNNWWTRGGHGNVITFYNQQECIHFLDIDNKTLSTQASFIIHDRYGFLEN